MINMISGRKIILRKRRLNDAHNDYAWQTDPELAQLDAVSPLNMPFEDYLTEYVSQLSNPNPTRYSFALETIDGKHIGNCVYYNVSESKGEAELGVMIGNRDYWDKGYGTDAVATLVDYIFRETNLKRIYLKTLDWNTRARKCFQKCHFTLHEHADRDGYRFQLMDLHRKQWQKLQDKT